MTTSSKATGSTVFPGNGHLAPQSIPKYMAELTRPARMSPLTRTAWMDGQPTFEVGIRQFRQQVLPPGYPKTTVWGYGAAGGEIEYFSWPGPVFDVLKDQPVWVRWVNQLVDDPVRASPQFLPHLFTVDQTLHWRIRVAR